LLDRIFKVPRRKFILLVVAPTATMILAGKSVWVLN